MRSVSYEVLNYRVGDPTSNNTTTLYTLSQVKKALVYEDGANPILPSNYNINTGFLYVSEGISAVGKPKVFRVDPFLPSFFDMRESTKSVALDNDILMFVNEYV